MVVKKYLCVCMYAYTGAYTNENLVIKYISTKTCAPVILYHRKSLDFLAYLVWGVHILQCLYSNSIVSTYSNSLYVRKGIIIYSLEMSQQLVPIDGSHLFVNTTRQLWSHPSSCGKNSFPSTNLEKQMQ